MTQTGTPSFGYSLTGNNQWDNPSPIGTYTIEQDDTTNTGTFGFELDLGGDGFFTDWSLRGYTQFGENRQKQRFENGIRMDHLPLSLDAVTNPANGQPACRAALVNPAVFGNCVPVNMFGGTRNVSAAAAAYLVDPEKIIDTTSKQYFTEVVADGQVAQGWAGPILMAMGASHRKDEIYQYVPDLTDEFVFLNGVNTGFRGLVPEGAPGGMLGVRPGSVPPGFTGASNLAQVLFTGSFQTPDTVLAGSFQVREAFAEINVPLLADKRAAQRLDANFAYRWADYTGSGGINSWKYGLSWQIVDSFRFRATGSRDVRAATLRERFDATAGGAQVLDPVFGNAQIGTASRSGGNPNVNPEEADTVTFGVVYQPAGLSKFLGLRRLVQHRHQRRVGSTEFPEHRQRMLQRRAGSVPVRDSRPGVERDRAHRQPFHQYQQPGARGPRPGAALLALHRRRSSCNGGSSPTGWPRTRCSFPVRRATTSIGSGRSTASRPTSVIRAGASRCSSTSAGSTGICSTGSFAKASMSTRTTWDRGRRRI